jgi:hypothetical protein
MPAHPDNPDAANLLIVEETAHLEKRDVSRRVRIRTKTETVEEILQDSVQADVVEVNRIAKDQEVDTAPMVRTEGDVMIVPVLEEVLVSRSASS